jgi:predicted tellurium resistance membrane protein TerC
MERYPVIVVFGACLIGWVGGETIVSDVLLRETVQAAPWLHYVGAAIGALAVYLIGKYMQKRAAAAHHHDPE